MGTNGRGSRGGVFLPPVILSCEVLGVMEHGWGLRLLQGRPVEGPSSVSSAHLPPHCEPQCTLEPGLPSLPTGVASGSG